MSVHSNDRIPVDQREEIANTDKPAKKGELTNSRLVKNATTHVDLAESQLRNAIRYYEIAADWYFKAGNDTMANVQRGIANDIRKALSPL